MMIRLCKRILFIGLPICLLLLLGNLLLVRAETAVSEAISTSSTHKVVQGHVETAAGEPVAHALVVAHRRHRDERVVGTTDEMGAYEMTLATGLWAITTRPTDETIPNHWVYPRPAQEVAFHHDDRPETHEVNFTVLLADAALVGTVVMPDGSVPPFPVTVNLHNGEGIGREVTIDPATDAFEVRLPHGNYDIIVHPQSDAVAAPRLAPVHLPPNETVDLGTIQLLARDAIIAGKVTDMDGNGVTGVPLVAWQGDRPSSLMTHSGDDGSYALTVMSGTWHIQPALGADWSYLYLGSGATVAVNAGETVSGVDFELIATDATIEGVLVTETDVAVHDLDAWVTAVNVNHPDIHNGSPVRQSQFALHVIGGDYLVSVHLPPGSPYLAPSEIPVSVAAGETVSLKIPLREKDAAIAGAVVDPRNDHRPVTGVGGRVSAWNGDQWAGTQIRPDSGRYELDVAAGIWRLNYEIASEEYIKIGSAVNIPAEAGQTANWPLAVTRKDGGLAGQVLQPNGEPLPGAMVLIDGIGGEVANLWLNVAADDNGRFRVDVPHGRYRLAATGGVPNWIYPFEQTVDVAPNRVIEGIELAFHEPNAVISGALTLPNGDANGDVLVWAWSERGGINGGHFPIAPVDGGGVAGAYALTAVSGTVWHVGAIFETDTAFWVAEGRVDVDGELAMLDLELVGPHPKPASVIVTFDASHAQRIILADGTSIFVPAGALPVEGRVTLRIVPIATLPHQTYARIIKYGYAIFATDASGRAIEAQFNHPVTIRFAYDARDIRGNDHRLRPAYFSITTNQWTVPEHSVVHPDENVVIMDVDHFTNFALIEGSQGMSLFLPLIAN